MIESIGAIGSELFAPILDMINDIRCKIYKHNWCTVEGIGNLVCKRCGLIKCSSSLPFKVRVEITEKVGNGK